METDTTALDSMLRVFHKKMDVLGESLAHGLPEGYSYLVHSPYHYSYTSDDHIVRQPIVIHNREHDVVVSMSVELTSRQWNIQAVGIVGCSFVLNSNFSNDEYTEAIMDGFQNIVVNILGIIESGK